MVMGETTEGFEGGLQIGRRISNLRYADDIVLIATSAQELQTVNRLNIINKRYRHNLLINTEKTKVMTTGNGGCYITIDNQTVEVMEFPYLGSVITSDAECTADIRARFNKGQGIVSSLRKTWKSHDVTTDTKVRLLQTLVRPVACKRM